MLKMDETISFPKRFNFKEVQEKWKDFWQKNNIYSFDINKGGKIFTIDTPPPFVSGTLHMGHILNHSWIDFVARFRKMRGYNVYFPQGFDCHGLPVELAVAKNYGISKDDRELFLKKCIEWVDKNIKNMKIQLDDLGYSTDWNYTYRTMDDSYKKKVQKSLIDFYEKGLLYREKFPTHFCVKCQTSVAKAEVGYEEEKGKLYYIKLPLVERDGEFITIATTRPEYIEACVAVMINPRDERYYDLSAAQVKIPIADRIVRIYMDETVDMNFGTGIVYVCTYGDETDIKWKLEYDLDEIQIFTTDGRMNENSKYKGLTIPEARKAIVKDLEMRGLIEKIEDYEHSIIVHSERSSCRNPIEYLPVYQWFINVKDFTKDIIESAENMRWYPEKHKKRLIDWANGLDWNWVISRQRVFGTPIPFWYCDDCGEIIPPNKEDLPLDPVKTPPPVKTCPKCNSKNIIGEKDVCDCWIDSSITPLAIAKWLEDDDFFKKTYMDAIVHRPQGYEIIRTWLFYTLFRCKILTGKTPFSETMINGMVAGPDGRHMSKSYGNMISPDEVIPFYGVDAIRQWAAMGSLGDDYPFEFTWINVHTKQPVSNEKILKERVKLSEKEFNKKYQRRCEQLIGASRFLTKVWNAFRFLYLNAKDVNLSNLEPILEDLTPIESYYFSEFNKKLEKITMNFEGYNWHEGFMILRTFFWNEICDNYIESIKYRFYSSDLKLKKNSIKNALNLFYKLLIIMSIIMPYISEEIYSLLFKKHIKLESIHLEKWPSPYENISQQEAEKGYVAIQIIKNLRNVKSRLKLPLNKEISRIILSARKEKIKLLNELKEDIRNTIRVKELNIIEIDESHQTLEKPDFEEKYEDLGVQILFFK